MGAGGAGGNPHAVRIRALEAMVSNSDKRIEALEQMALELTAKVDDIRDQLGIEKQEAEAS